jgi:hypothetical protein
LPLSLSQKALQKKLPKLNSHESSFWKKGQKIFFCPFLLRGQFIDRADLLIDSSKFPAKLFLQAHSPCRLDTPEKAYR